MRVRNVLSLLSAVVTLGLGAQVAPAQDRLNFTVDGDWQDWGTSFYLDDISDVTPDTNSTVDIMQYSFGWGEYGPHDIPRRELFAFIFRFYVPPFHGSDPTTVDLFFDVSPDTTSGDRTAPWKGFRPEYRFTVTGQGGRLTTETYRRYTGGRWNPPTESADITELEVALAGQWLEGAIPWSALGGFPALSQDGLMPDIRTFGWAVQVSKGSYRDYIPDASDEWHSWEVFLTTIQSLPWGEVKNFND